MRSSAFAAAAVRKHASWDKVAGAIAFDLGVRATSDQPGRYVGALTTRAAPARTAQSGRALRKRGCVRCQRHLAYPGRAGLVAAVPLAAR